MQHKHHKEIKAWADGAEIEQRGAIGWGLAVCPQWHLDVEYRIKPQQQTCTVWVNVYEDATCAYLNITDAENMRADDCIACVEAEIKYTEGEGL